MTPVQGIQQALEESGADGRLQDRSPPASLAAGGINSNGMVAVKDKEVTRADVARVIKTTHERSTFSTDSFNWSRRRSRHRRTGRAQADRHERYVEAKCTSSRVLKARLKTSSLRVRRCGLEVDQLMLNPLASSMAVLTQDASVTWAWHWWTLAPVPPMWRFFAGGGSATP
jgi:cell division protein FtsA